MGKLYKNRFKLNEKEKRKRKSKEIKQSWKRELINFN